MSLKDLHMERILLLSWDFVFSFLWEWFGALTKVAVIGILGPGHHPLGEVLRGALYVCSLFFLAWMSKLTKGGCGNPMTVLTWSVSEDPDSLPYTVLARIPTQVLGATLAVILITLILHPTTYGVGVNAGIHHAALIEGIISFGMVLVSLALTKFDPKSFFMRTWIHSVCRLALRILGSNITGGIMNPAAASGWAFVLRNQSLEGHVFVYWVAPLGATLLAVWMFGLFLQPPKQKKA